MAAPRRDCGAYCLMLVVLVACLLPHRAAAQSTSQQVGEAELLLQIKRAWGDPPVLAAWSAAASAAGAHCRWPYVGCDSAGRVTSLGLDSINLTGPVPDAIGSLSSLAYLYLYNNSITGVFPTALYRCRSLRYLGLDSNNLEGELPDDIGHGLAANLSTLDLSGNEFKGSIPASLSMLQNLRRLVLQFNPFWPSELPASFKNLTSLVSLEVVNCSLVGDFPSSVVKMPQLEFLDLSENSLEGSIPPGIWSLENLQALYLSKNNFTGDIKIDGFAAMNLEVIDLSENKLNGTIPEVFGHLVNLWGLYLFSNNFSGEIPANLGGDTLNYLYLHDNQLSGEIPTNLVYGSPRLTRLNLANNKLSGRIC